MRTEKCRVCGQDMQVDEFFSEPPAPGASAHDECQRAPWDYRLCFEAMGAGQSENRAILERRYGYTLDTVGALNTLAEILFELMTPDEKKLDLRSCEQALESI